MSRKQAIASVKASANAVIEQMTRRAKGWDSGMYRQDDVHRLTTIRHAMQMEVASAFALSRQFRSTP